MNEKLFLTMLGGDLSTAKSNIANLLSSLRENEKQARYLETQLDLEYAKKEMLEEKIQETLNQTSARVISEVGV